MESLTNMQEIIIQFRKDYKKAYKKVEKDYSDRWHDTIRKLDDKYARYLVGSGSYDGYEIRTIKDEMRQSMMRIDNLR